MICPERRGRKGGREIVMKGNRRMKREAVIRSIYLAWSELNLFLNTSKMEFLRGKRNKYLLLLYAYLRTLTDKSEWATS